MEFYQAKWSKLKTKAKKPEGWDSLNRVSYIKQIEARRDKGIFFSAGDWGCSLWEKSPYFKKMLPFLHVWISEGKAIAITGRLTEPFFSFRILEGETAIWEPSDEVDNCWIDASDREDDNWIEELGGQVEIETAQVTLNHFFKGMASLDQEDFLPPTSPLQPPPTSSSTKAKNPRT